MDPRIDIDIIMVSYAQTIELKQITENAIQSLMDSENPQEIHFNIIILESEKSYKPFQYPNSETIYPDVPFGYHRYLNIGIAKSTSPFICICNNDLLFHKNWASEILKPFYQYADVVSASPICSIHHVKNGYRLNDGVKLGYRIRDEVTGWCLFFKRDLLRVTGRLDENYIFWCADNDYVNTLYVLNLPHILVTSSIVDHLESKTLNAQTEERREELTKKEVIYSGKKWNHRLGERWQPMD